MSFLLTDVAHSRPWDRDPWWKVLSPLPGKVWQLYSKEEGLGIRVHTLTLLCPYAELGTSGGIKSELLTTPEGTEAQKGLGRQSL